jgi:hypothetical protein
MNNTSPYETLLNDFCVGLGFCGSVVDGQPLQVDHFVPENGTVSADQFVDWVFRAEGVNPHGPDALKHRDTLRQAFVKHMGETADAQSLR